MLLVTTEPARPARIREWPHAWALAVATVCFGAFMGQLDASVVTLTYRPVQHEFSAGLAGVEWVSLSYLLTLTALLVPVGRWSDRRGRKLSYLHGFIVFTAASVACGLAPSLPVLIAARAVQGAGAALLQANSVALVTTSAPAGRMRAALGIQAGAQALGLALGPTLGGLLVQNAGWRYVYFINAPVGILAAAIGIYLLPRTRHRSEPQPLDRSGTALLALCTTTVLLAISSVSGLRIPAGATALLAVGAAGTGWLLVRRQRQAAYPIIDPGFLRDRSVSTGLVAALFGYLALFGPLVLIPVALEARGVSALHAGLVLTALPAGFAVAGIGSGPLLPKSWTNRARCLLGSALTAAALLVGLVVPVEPWTMVAVLAGAGIGLGLFTPSNNAQVMGAIPPSASGTVGGMLNMARGFGTALGISIVTLGLHLGSPGRGQVRPALVALIAAALLALVATAAHRGAVGGSISPSPSEP